jgi:UDP-N-acetyl-D-glucosamine dehydrogenase
VPEIPATREYGALKGRRSVAAERAAEFDAVLIVTDHDAVDYAALARAAPLIVDTRNAMARHGLSGGHIVKA